MSLTTSATDLELTLADGSVVTVALDWPRGPDGTPIEGAPKQLSEALVASDADTPLSVQRESEVTDDWSGGVGVSYAAAEGLYTRTPGVVLPAGAATDVVIPAAHNSASVIEAFCEYNGDLYCAQYGTGVDGTGRVLRAIGGTGAFADVLNLGVGEYVSGLLVYGDGAGGSALYACSSDSGGANGRLHQTTDGTTWTSTAVGLFGTNGRYRIARVYWVTRDGKAGFRMVAISGQRALSYTRPNTDPMLAASWVEAAITVESISGLGHLISSGRHVYAGSAGEVFDFDEQGHVTNLTAYSAQTLLPSLSPVPVASEASVLYHDGYIYSRLGSGLDRINVDTQNLQELPGQCGPGWGTPAENRWSGFVTCLHSEQGYVLAAVWSPNTATSGIFWGKDARYFPDVRTRNPLVWFGPEVVTANFYRVIRMHVGGLGGSMRLWISSYSSFDTAGLSWISLPIDGSSLQDLLGSGRHRYADGAGAGIWQSWCRLYGLKKEFKSRKSTKHIHQNVLGTRGLTGATKLVQYTRADAPPGGLDWGFGVDVTTSASQAVTPTLQTSGNRIEQRTDFFAPSGAATPPVVPVLELLETTAWRVAPDFDVWDVPIIYGAGVWERGMAQADSRRDPDQTTLALRTAARAAPIGLRDARGLRYTAKVLQVIGRSVQVHADGSGKTIRATLKLAGVTPA